MTATGAVAADNVGYVYDNAGRLSNTTANGKTISYLYDAAGNRTRMTWPDTAFFVTTAYDALNRLTVLKENDTANLASYAYDDLSRRTTVTLGNGTTTAYGYNAQGDMSSLAHNLTGTTHDQTYGYTRNQAREIVAHSWSNDVYQWPVVGNVANGTKSYTANGLNQYTAAAGSAVTHDANGNLTGDGTWTYGYDQNNRLRTATKSGTSATLAYDAEGRLRQSVVTAGTAATLNKAYDGVDLVAEYDAGGALQRRWVHGPGVDEPLVAYEGATTAAKSWLYADHLGSIVATADATGTNTAIYSYGPYGEPSTMTGQRFRYTGQQLIGGLDIYYYKARFYDPKLGRFLQTDPIGTQDDMNLYAYVGGNPVNFNDPSGLAAAQAKILGGYLTGAAKVVGDASDLWTGGYGAMMNQSWREGNIAGGLGYLGAGAAFGVMNTMSGGVGSALGKTSTMAAKGATTSLYRAVGPAELASINKTGAFTNIAGIEGKYFTTSAAEASAYGKQAVRAFGDAPYTTVRTQVPNSFLNGLSPVKVDGGIPAWVLPTDRLKGLVPNVMNHSALPPFGF